MMNAEGATPEIIARWGQPTPAHDPVMLSMFKPRATDVLIATPAKSGTTWMQNILYQIKHKGDDSFQNIFDSVVSCRFVPICCVTFHSHGLRSAKVL